MCGLVGVFDLRDDAPIDQEMVKRMTDSLHHRGPDGDGYHFAPGIALGHRRLAIIDPAGGDQPIYNEDGTVAVVFNGCIYNFAELRRHLEGVGHIFKTNCDTEVIVHAWEEWGTDCVTHFRGMFAFAIWDANTESLFLARDRLGKKPLYYAELPSGLIIFGSELKALLVNPTLSRELDPCAVDEYFAFGYIPDPRTIYRSVCKLPPAHALLVRRGTSPRVSRYWDLRFAPQERPEAQICEELVERLEDAVALRLVSDVPLGAFLSGGVDSSAIVATMSRLSSDPVHCFSVGFGDREFDETEYARTVAERFGAHHVIDKVDPSDLLSLDGLISTFDEPFGDSSALPTTRVCAAASRGVKVALSGDGGDELFAGYRRHKWHMVQDRVRGFIPDSLRERLFGTLASIYPNLGWAPRSLRAKHTFEELAQSPADAYFQSVAVTSDAIRQRLLSGRLKAELQGYQAKRLIHSAVEASESDDPLAQVLYADITTWLPGDILTKVDRASMANSLEVRAPLLDHCFVEWAATLPSTVKIRGNTGKHILKRALEPSLPRSILYRQKQGFSMPIATWFRGPLRVKIQKAIGNPVLLDSGYFCRNELLRLVDDHERGRRDCSSILWLVLVFEAFLVSR